MANDKSVSVNAARRTKLSVLIEAKGVRMIDVARALHVNPSSVHFWVSGVFQPRAANLIDLCNFFDVDAEDVIGYVDEAAAVPELEAAR